MLKKPEDIMIEINFIRLSQYFEQIFLKHVISQLFGHSLKFIILSLFILIVAFATNYISKKIINKLAKHWVSKSIYNYDRIFYEKGIFQKLSHLAPIFIFFYIAPLVFEEYENVANFVRTAANIYLIVIVLIILNSVINAFHDIFNSLPTTKNRSIKGYVHFVKSLIIFIGSLMVLSILVKRDLSSLFAGLTAFAAVLMFVFKDAILGLVAGIQISAHDILRVGDFIEMPGRNVDGTVIDISLSIVKVHNSNRTISIIPIYAFVSETFMNWRGIDMSKDRLIKRHIYLDIQTIKNCDGTMLDKLKNSKLLKSYFELKIFEQNGYTEEAIGEGKSFTNASLFRVYAEIYLQNNPDINSQAILMVRYLQPTEHGLPFQIFAYTKQTETAQFEKVQSNILEHFISVVPEFGLKIFQEPTSFDNMNI